MTKNQAKQRIEKLKKLIDYHRYLYHVLDRQEISQSALDSLKKELFDLEQRYPEFITPDSPTQRVGGKPLEKFEKVKHLFPMFSINDAFGRKDMEDWQDRNKKLLTETDISKIDFYCELKLDGLAIELVYENGILKTGSTRGNGIIGEDITQNLKTIEAIPLRIRQPSDVIGELRKEGLKSIASNISFYRTGAGISQAFFQDKKSSTLVARGEVFITKKNFEKVNKARKKAGLPIYANPRNLAAGSVRQLDPEITSQRFLDSHIYNLITDLGQTSHEESHKILKILGFKTNRFNKYCKDSKEVFEYFKKSQRLREKLPYEIDGIVVNINNNRIFEKLGVVGKAPRGVIALKFPLKQATTIVKDIRVQVGRTGALTPVAILKPVEVGGVTISRATLHNEDEIQRLGVKIGDTVIVGRAGDVIPDILRVLPELRTGKEKGFKIPKKCPVCGGEIEKPEGEVVSRCLNPNCFAKQKRSFYHFVSKPAFNIVGLGPKIINQLLKEGVVRDPADLFDLREGDLILLERFAEKSAGNLINAIQENKKITLPRFIFALGIRNVGEETAQDLGEYFGTLENLKKASLLDLENIRDIGPVVAQSLHCWFREKRNLNFLKKLKRAGVKVRSQTPTPYRQEVPGVGLESLERKLPALYRAGKTQNMKGRMFVLTGTLKIMTRGEAKEKIRVLGGRLSNSVSKNTDYLVVGENPGSKLKRAKELGVKIIGEKEFLKMVEVKPYGPE